MTEYAKYIDDTHIEYAPKNYNGISNYNKNIELLKTDGYYEVIQAEKPSETCTLSYKLKYKKIYEIWTETALEELKKMKRAEINKARDETEQGGFEYLGKIFDSDPISCIRISSAAQALQLIDNESSQYSPIITWTCKDNSTIDLNSNDLAGLIIALAEHSNVCHERATYLKDQIDKCTSKDELDKIKW